MSLFMFFSFTWHVSCCRCLWLILMPWWQREGAPIWNTVAQGLPSSQSWWMTEFHQEPNCFGFWFCSVPPQRTLVQHQHLNAEVPTPTWQYERASQICSSRSPLKNVGSLITLKYFCIELSWLRQWVFQRVQNNSYLILHWCHVPPKVLYVERGWVFGHGNVHGLVVQKLLTQFVTLVRSVVWEKFRKPKKNTMCTDLVK